MCIACSNDTDKSEPAIEKEQESKKEQPEKTDVTEEGYESLIGETIAISDDGSLSLPFEEQVREAAFSEDGKIKLLETKKGTILIKDDTVVHAAEAGSIAPPAVSEDGRFAVWNTNNDWEPAIYDFETDELQIVELTDEDDPYNIQAYDFPLIEKHGDTYYLMDNMHMYGLPPIGALDLNEGKIYTNFNDEDQEVLDTLAPTAVVDDDTYHTYEADVRTRINPNGDSDNIFELKSDDGLYEVYFKADRIDDSELLVRELYGVETPTGTVMPISTEEVGIDLSKETTKLHATLAIIDDIKISDSGMLLLPIFEEEGDTIHMSIFVVDLTEEEPKLHLIEEREVANDPDERPILIFNFDATGFYVSNVDGTMDYFSTGEK